MTDETNRDDSEQANELNVGEDPRDINNQSSDEEPPRQVNIDIFATRRQAVIEVDPIRRRQLVEQLRAVEAQVVLERPNGFETVEQGASAVRQCAIGAGAARQNGNGAGAVRLGANETEAVRQGANGAEAVRQDVNEAEAVRQDDNGAEAVRQGASGAEAVRQGDNGAEAVREGDNGAEAVREGDNGAEAVREDADGAEVPNEVIQIESDDGDDAVEQDDVLESDMLQEPTPAVETATPPQSWWSKYRDLSIGVVVGLIFVAVMIYLLCMKRMETRTRIAQGRVEGSIEYLTSGLTYLSFKGIPYAKPPIGELRYKAPQPPDNWTYIHYAQRHGDHCTQFKFNSVLKGSEDCLYLNVYTRDLEKKLLPVMVWFHGGSFISGSGDSVPYGPKYLMEFNVVLVTANYRLDALGYLSLGTENIPGNAGMKDQVAVLRWVKQNINQFGGDPSKVTVFGQSAGAAAVSHHMLSPMSTGLYHNMILQSGSFMYDWSFSVDGTSHAIKVAHLLGQNTTDLNELEEFFMTEPAETLVGASTLSMTPAERQRGYKGFYTPVLEQEFEGQEAFLTRSPLEILTDRSFNKAPLIIGYTDAEGLLMLRYTDKNITLDQIFDSIDMRIPPRIRHTITPEEYEEVVASIESFYFDNVTTSEEIFTNLTNFESDAMFSYQMVNLASIVAKFQYEPVYVYRFSFDGKNNIPKKNINLRDRKGACHGDEVFYIFNFEDDIIYGTVEDIVSQRLLHMWTDFARFSEPVPSVNNLIPVKWTPYDGKNVSFLNIDRNLTMETKYPEEKRFQFWERIFTDIFGNSSAPPYFRY